jgi:peroxin-1
VLVDTPQIDGQTRKKAEAYVGWTGMPAASSLANYGGKSVGGELETIEVDPLFADVIGLKRSDVVCRALFDSDTNC